MNIRVAARQKVTKFLTFHWPLNSFHRPFINEKHVYIHFSLFCRPSIVFSSFSTSFLFSRKEEEGVWKKAFTTKTTDHNYYMCQTWSVKLIVLLALQHTFRLFRKKMHSLILKKTYKLQTGKHNSPRLFTNLENIKDFLWLFPERL